MPDVSRQLFELARLIREGARDYAGGIERRGERGLLAAKTLYDIRQGKAAEQRATERFAMERERFERGKEKEKRLRPLEEFQISQAVRGNELLQRQIKTEEQQKQQPWMLGPELGNMFANNPEAQRKLAYYVDPIVKIYGKDVTYSPEQKGAVRNGKLLSVYERNKKLPQLIAGIALVSEEPPETRLMRMAQAGDATAQQRLAKLRTDKTERAKLYLEDAEWRAGLLHGLMSGGDVSADTITKLTEPIDESREQAYKWLDEDAKEKNKKVKYGTREIEQKMPDGSVRVFVYLTDPYTKQRLGMVDSYLKITSPKIPQGIKDRHNEIMTERRELIKQQATDPESFELNDGAQKLRKNDKKLAQFYVDNWGAYFPGQELPKEQPPGEVSDAVRNEADRLLKLPEAEQAKWFERSMKISPEYTESVRLEMQRKFTQKTPKKHGGAGGGFDIRDTLDKNIPITAPPPETNKIEAAIQAIAQIKASGGSGREINKWKEVFISQYPNYADQLEKALQATRFGGLGGKGDIKGAKRFLQKLGERGPIPTKPLRKLTIEDLLRQSK